jgi:alkaline phosphatase D
VIANDLPLGLVVPDTSGTFEGVSQADNGPPLDRELEFAEILRFVHQRAIGGIVFLTADVHYTSAHHYDPSRAAIGDLHAVLGVRLRAAERGCVRPERANTTFGPQTVFAASPPAANTSPADGFQFFGHVAIDGHSEVMTVTLYDLDGKAVQHAA